MTRADLLRFLRAHRYGVEASVTSGGRPQAAVVGVVVTDDFELFFDTLETTRKAVNLRAHNQVAFVFGGTDATGEQTVQYEGVTDEPDGVELERLKQLYFDRFVDGPARQAWKGLIYVRAQPTWLRYSDFRADPPLILELDAAGLDCLK